MSSAPAEDKRCPVCGRGVLRHLGTEAGKREQQPESPIRETYTCGHEIREEPLALLCPGGLENGLTGAERDLAR